MRSIAILGASRGLGRALADLIKQNHTDIRLMLMARKVQTLQAEKNFSSDVIKTADFASTETMQNVFEALEEFKPEIIVYSAGGGPYGSYASKAWKDHWWALQVNLVFPSALTHFALVNLPKLKGLFLVGSAVAESQPDPMAAAYASAKHGLKGLCDTLRAENPQSKVHLFSPSYMDTGLLPANAWPRQSGIVEPVEKVAERLWQEIQSSVN